MFCDKSMHKSVARCSAAVENGVGRRVKNTSIFIYINIAIFIKGVAVRKLTATLQRSVFKFDTKKWAWHS